MKHAERLLIHKSLTGEITESEKAEFSRWLSLDPKNYHLFEEIKLIWDHSDFADDTIEYDPEEELLKIKKRINTA